MPTYNWLGRRWHEGVVGEMEIIGGSPYRILEPTTLLNQSIHVLKILDVDHFKSLLTFFFFTAVLLFYV